MLPWGHVRYGAAPGADGFPESFSSDAAWYVGPLPHMGFPKGAPIFAVEVRSENAYGRSAEEQSKEKRADYFACGTQVVWDVGLRSEDVIKS